MIIQDTKYKILDTLCFLTVSVLLFVFSIQTANAQALDLSVSPPIFQIELTPPANATTEQNLTVKNTGSQPLELDLSFRPFQASETEDGIPILLDESKPIPGANPNILERISILEDGKEINSLNLAPGQEKTLELAVSVAKDEPPSDYYLTLLFISRPEQSKAQSSQSITTGGVGVNILLNIGPKKASTGILEEFSTPFFMEEGPVPFTVRLKNTSNHFIYPEGNITIKNMFGQTIGQVELLPVNILSGSTRFLPSAEHFSALAELERIKNSDTSNEKEYENALKALELFNSPRAFWNENFLLGPYTATLEIALSDQGPVIVRKIHFLGFPLYLIFGIFIAIFILIFIRSRLKKRGA